MQQSIGVMIVFIVFNVIIDFSYLLPTLIQDNDNFYAVKVGTSVGFLYLTTFFINPFIYAGVYGITFRKMSSRRINFYNFISLAKNNYWIFFRINFVMVVIFALYFEFFPHMLTFVNVSTDYHKTINSYTSPIFSLLIGLFFVFAYPLAIVGFFSNQNLKPIRSSFSKVFNNFGKIKFIIFLLLLNYLIGLLFGFVIPDSHPYYKNILSTVLTTAVDFIILVYSYLLITEHFNKDLQLNFDKTT